LGLIFLAMSPGKSKNLWWIDLLDKARKLRLPLLQEQLQCLLPKLLLLKGWLTQLQGQWLK
jgi:hypothetical protein